MSERVTLTVDDPTHGKLDFDALIAGPVDGPPVILLHGFPQAGSSWRRIWPGLAEAGYRVLVPDQRGYSPGARPPGDEDYAVLELVGDVIAFADSQGWGSFALVGHDWGGAVAWQVAGRHPDRVERLAVVSTPHPNAFTAALDGAGPVGDDDQSTKSSYLADFRDPGLPAMMMADDRGVLGLVLEGSGMDPESAALCAERIQTVEDMDGALRWYRAGSPAAAGGLGPITMPTLYVWSTDDIALGRTAAELTGDQVDGPYRFEVLDGISHWIPEEAPDVLGALLLEHLKS